MSAVVELQDVHKKFGTNTVLNGVSFSVEKGQVVAIIGQSGSGKSTALRCIDRLETIDQGRIIACGHEVSDPKVDLLTLRKDIGIVFQGYNLFPHLTVQRNITLALTSVKKMHRSQANAVAEEVLDQVGLLGKIHAYPEELSGGQQQRVAIARSLAMHPSLMLFDEVTSALDPQLTGEVLRVMEGLAKNGMTMIMVTHEMGFAQKIADIIIYMHHGKVWEIGGRTLLQSPQTKELQDFISNGL
ncbi:amino acid ABC transporter ATP-binding protein [Castellaniella sp. WN]